MRFRSSTTVLIVALLALIGGAATNASAQGLTGQISGTSSIPAERRASWRDHHCEEHRNIQARRRRRRRRAASRRHQPSRRHLQSQVTLEGFKRYGTDRHGISASSVWRCRPSCWGRRCGRSGVGRGASRRSADAERRTSATITSEEIQDIGLRGRDFMGALKPLPGVIDTAPETRPAGDRSAA